MLTLSKEVLWKNSHGQESNTGAPCPESCIGKQHMHSFYSCEVNFKCK